jgi:hypothetical protein
MKEEMAFLKYRREVVRTWPESPRKAVFLTAIESRIVTVQRQVQIISAAALQFGSRALIGMECPKSEQTV